MANAGGPTVDNVFTNEGLSNTLKELLVGSAPRLETSLSFKYVEVTTVEETITGAWTIPIGDSCEFFVNSIFYNTIDDEKKARLRNICQLLFKMKLLKTNEGGRFLNEMYDFIESNIVEWKEFLNGNAEASIQPSKDQFEYQVANEGQRSYAEGPRSYARYSDLNFNTGKNMPLFINRPNVSTEEEQNLGENSIFINMHPGYLGQVLKTDGSGYFVNKKQIREWCTELADVIGTVITRLSNRKRVIHTRGIPHFLGEPIEEMYRHSLVWEWSYITIREDLWFTEETARLIQRIAPVLSPVNGDKSPVNGKKSLSSRLCLRF